MAKRVGIEKIHELVNKGFKNQQIADKLKCSLRTVVTHKKSLMDGTALAMATSKLKKEQQEKTEETVEQVSIAIDQQINCFEQLNKINIVANDALDGLMKTNKAEKTIHQKAVLMREIREQIALQTKIFKTMWDVNASQQFQDIVLKTIGDVAPEVRERIMIELNAKSSVRSALKI